MKKEINCKYIEECRRGCRFSAAQFGDPFGPDPVMCSFYSVEYNKNGN